MKDVPTPAPLRIAVIASTIRPGRQGIKPAKFLVSFLKKQGHDATLVDPLEWDLPLLSKAYHHYREGETRPEKLENLYKILKDADAYLVVTGEYNHSVPPPLANLLDYFPGSVYSFKPSGICSYSAGPWGGQRAAVHLKVLLGELGCIPVSNIFAIGEIGKAFSDEEGTPTPEFADRLTRGATGLVKQIVWWANAARTQRAAGLP
eukprot:TRINITY_DN15590_c0_g1_i1.p1 TRINITY_DN15590_c0_g1~~TRINITY_DN15590_c0_g1_i1.p1  ORF type:complete len:226 (-),score=27.11 TRINITY_DN15590_c0_g1_i1:61-675(-)